MATVTLVEAGDRIGLSPLEVVLQCALRGFPCENGLIDEGVLPILGTVQLGSPEGETDPGGPAPSTDETDEERRLRVVRRVLERLARMGKYMPARTEKRATGRGLEGSDVGLALRAVDALLDCGLMRQEHHGGREQKVGLNGDRRGEIADIIEGKSIADDTLRAWIAEG